MAGTGWEGPIDSEAIVKRFACRKVTSDRRGDDDTFLFAFQALRITIMAEARTQKKWLMNELSTNKASQLEVKALRGHARLIDLAPVANIGRLLDGTITFWSAGAEHLYGWSKEEALGRRTHDLLQTKFPDDESLETIVEKVRRGEAWGGELEHSTRSGKRIKVQSYWLGELDAAGNVIELLESNLDLTDRRRAELAFQESEKRFR